MQQTTLSRYVKAMRKQYGLTQVDLSEKSGVGLRFVRELEQGKQTLRLDKVNLILNLFGSEVGAVPLSKNTFQYDGGFLTSEKAEAISLTLPLTDRPYRDKVLFPFFDGLIPEGWLLDIAERNWKIDARDRMSLLLACCKDCIGAVGVEPITGKEQ